MTYEQTREQFLLAWNSNAYLNMCESDDMRNAINAIDKQIPKSPNCKRYSDDTRCPVCNTFVLFKTKYCIECGQAIDWE